MLQKLQDPNFSQRSYGKLNIQQEIIYNQPQLHYYKLKKFSSSLKTKLNLKGFQQ